MSLLSARLLCKTGAALLLSALSGTAMAEDFLFSARKVEYVLATIQDAGQRAVVREIVLDRNPPIPGASNQSQDLRSFNQARERLMQTGIPAAQALALMSSGGPSYSKEAFERVSWKLTDLPEVFGLLITSGVAIPDFDSEGSIVLVAQSQWLALPMARTLKIPAPGKPAVLTSEGVTHWLSMMVRDSLATNSWDDASVKTLHDLQAFLGSGQMPRREIVPQAPPPKEPSKVVTGSVPVSQQTPAGGMLPIAAIAAAVLATGWLVWRWLRRPVR